MFQHVPSSCTWEVPWSSFLGVLFFPSANVLPTFGCRIDDQALLERHTESPWFSGPVGAAVMVVGGGCISNMKGTELTLRTNIYIYT